jgi:hypothetical protein
MVWGSAEVGWGFAAVAVISVAVGRVWAAAAEVCSATAGGGVIWSATAVFPVKLAATAGGAGSEEK